MLQRYKLRLGDGTVLGVDLNGLTTWALDAKAMVQAADSRQWYPLKEFLAAERLAARRAARQRAHHDVPVSDRPLPLVYPKPREDKASSSSVASEPMEVPSLDLPSDAPFLAAEAVELTLPDAAAEVAPVVAPVVEEGPAEAPPLAEEPLVEQVLPDPDPELPVAATEPLASADSFPEQSFIPDDAPPVLSRPLERGRVHHEPEAHSPAAEPEAPLFVDLALPASPRADEPTPRRLEPAALPSAPNEDVPWANEPFDPAPVATSAPRLQPLADDLVAPPAVPQVEPWKGRDEVEVIPLKPLDDEPPAAGRGVYEEDGYESEGPPLRSKLREAILRWVARGASAYDALLTGWIDNLGQRIKATSADARRAGLHDDLAPSLPLAPAPYQAAASPSRGLLPRETLVPPPPLRELPVLRLVDTPERVEEGHLYEGEGRLRAAGRIVTRLGVAAALVAGLLFLAVNWESWAPRVGRLGQAAFAQIDRARQAWDHREQQRQALQEATERLPHLAPPTIRQLMASSTSGSLDLPEMFRLASEATDRGLGALSAGEVQELKKLRGELLGSLRPSERERIREYDAARRRRLVFPFEGRDVLELFERGAYAMSPEGRERLQELLGKAIAAGLEAGPENDLNPRSQEG